ncbi:MAG TPA: MGMT family protein [Chloroflexota bacterium]|jgi:methylated-DNA-protein-cysteine methyltransferase-like protein
MAPAGSGFREQVCAVIRQIPRGRVATYGYLALLVGAPRSARRVGWVLRTLPPPFVWGRGESPYGEQEDDWLAGENASALLVPWHRVVNAQGRISGCATRAIGRQVALLRAEGVDVSDAGALIGGLERWGWWPDPGAVQVPEARQ